MVILREDVKCVCCKLGRATVLNWFCKMSLSVKHLFKAWKSSPMWASAPASDLLIPEANGPKVIDNAQQEAVTQGILLSHVEWLWSFDIPPSLFWSGPLASKPPEWMPLYNNPLLVKAFKGPSRLFACLSSFIPIV